MKTTIVAVGLALLALFAYNNIAYAQQMDGKNCEWAYKKLQQHRAYGRCFERGNAPDTERVQTNNGHEIRDRVRDAIGRLFD